MATTQLPISPLTYFPIQLSLIASLIAFSSPTSFLRAALLPIIVICNYLLLSTCSSYISRTPWITFFSGATLSHPLEYVEKLLLSQWSYECYGLNARTVSKQKADKHRDSISFSSSQSEVEGTILDRLKFGCWAAVSSRYVASSYQDLIRNGVRSMIDKIRAKPHS